MLVPTTDTTTRPRRTDRRTVRRAALAPAALVLALTVGACADDDDEGSLEASRAQLGAGPDADGLLGLEVTTVGEVTEVVDSNAFRIDKDGVGSDELTAGDEELGYGTDPQYTLVIVPGESVDVSPGDPVEVSGTIRSLDAEAIEEVYDVEIDADIYAPHLNQLVILAESVGGA